MKITLEFDGNDPDEMEKLELMQAAQRLYCVIENFKAYLRKELKHTEMSAEMYQTFETIQGKLFEEISDYHLEKFFF